LACRTCSTKAVILSASLSSSKLSFDEDKLADNISAFVEQVRHAKPAGVRGNYIESVTVSATMSPGIKVTV